MILSLKHQILHLEHWIEVLMSPRENSAEDFCSHLKKLKLNTLLVRFMISVKSFVESNAG